MKITQIRYHYYQRRAMNALVEQKWELAETYVNRMIQIQGPSLGLRYNLALSLLGQERFADVESNLLAAIEDYGSSLRLERLLGDMYYIWGKREESLYHYTKALEDDPQGKELHVIQSRIAIVTSNESYKRAHDILSLVPQARVLMKENPQKAFELYEQIALADPTHVEALNNLGSLCIDSFDDPQKGVQYFSQALSFVDNQATIQNMRRCKKELDTRSKKH